MTGRHWPLPPSTEPLRQFTTKREAPQVGGSVRALLVVSEPAAASRSVSMRQQPLGGRGVRDEHVQPPADQGGPDRAVLRRATGHTQSAIEIKPAGQLIQASIRYTKKVALLPFGIYNYSYDFSYTAAPQGYLLKE